MLRIWVLTVFTETDSSLAAPGARLATPYRVAPRDRRGVGYLSYAWSSALARCAGAFGASYSACASWSASARFPFRRQGPRYEALARSGFHGMSCSQPRCGTAPLSGGCRSGWLRRAGVNSPEGEALKWSSWMRWIGSASTGVGVHLHGRSEEVGEVVRAVDRLSASQGGALVLRGDSGIGKRR